MLSITDCEDFKDYKTYGSCLTFILQMTDDILYATVGDTSLYLMKYNPEKNKNQLIRLTPRHTPDNLTEVQRIRETLAEADRLPIRPSMRQLLQMIQTRFPERRDILETPPTVLLQRILGLARIRPFDMNAPFSKEEWRVIAEALYLPFDCLLPLIPRVKGSLMMTRSIGDYAMKQIGGIIGTPDIMAYKLTSNDIALVLTTDGVTDVLKDSEILDCLIPKDSPFYITSSPAQKIVSRAVYTASARTGMTLHEIT